MLPVVVLFACEKNITVNQLPYESKLSITSLITPGQIPKVYLYRTVPYFDPRQLAGQLFVRTAVVAINSLNGNIDFTIDSSYNVVRCDYDYYYKGSRLIEANMVYTLNIQYNGQTYTATATTDQRKINIDSIGYVTAYKDVYGEHEGVVLHFKDLPGQGDSYRFEMRRIIPDTVIAAGNGAISYCSIGKQNYVTEIGRTVYSDKYVDGQDMTFVFEPAFLHSQGQVAYIQMQSIDKNMFDFYDQLDRQKLAQYNPFVEPVFLQPLQFANAIGVFGAYALSDSVRFVYPE
jgi:hypothetical protein